MKYQRIMQSVSVRIVKIMRSFQAKEFIYANFSNEPLKNYENHQHTESNSLIVYFFNKNIVSPECHLKAKSRFSYSFKTCFPARNVGRRYV